MSTITRKGLTLHPIFPLKPYLLWPGEFRKLRGPCGPQGPEKKSFKFKQTYRAHLSSFNQLLITYKMMFDSIQISVLECSQQNLPEIKF